MKSIIIGRLLSNGRPTCFINDIFEQHKVYVPNLHFLSIGLGYICTVFKQARVKSNIFILIK